MSQLVPIGATLLIQTSVVCDRDQWVILTGRVPVSTKAGARLRAAAGCLIKFRCVLGLLNDRLQRLLAHAAGLQKAPKVGAFPQLWDAKRDGPGARLPIAVAVGVALRNAVGVALAGGRPGQGAHLQLHQSLGGEANHVA